MNVGMGGNKRAAKTWAATAAGTSAPATALGAVRGVPRPLFGTGLPPVRMVTKAPRD